ncbi:L1 [Gammapapillomavirus 13]|uniref:Major capsid protein L1 n=1 Tax=Gammapapillomavirus 13 TaxID=1513258 RepID=A0A2D2ALS5_9PAPI|nr:L1 [Gammapapillomavirus 13]
MSYWLPSNGPLYLPPAKPVPRVLQTDEYVINTNIFFYASTDRLLQVGHPYFAIYDDDSTTVKVPKVNASQYRVMRLRLPDPNQFALIDQNIFNPDEERLVWRVKGVEVDRGGPLGIGAVGHPLLNKYGDTENPLGRPIQEQTDNRVNLSFEPKQTQILIVGCTPPIGQHWDVAEPCQKQKTGDCPPLELRHTKIQDGDMCDIGLGAVNFKTFYQDRSGGTLDVIDGISKWPDFLQMSKNIYGDELFFFAKYEQLYARHFAAKAGKVGDKIPTGKNDSFYLDSETYKAEDSSYVYMTTPSGSLTSTNGQIFGRPYWLQKANGTNNGVCWDNNLFITVCDNTRATNFTLSVFNKNDGTIQNEYKYKAEDFNQYSRHVEEFEVELIFELCKVPLTADILAHLNVMNPTILENWKLAFVPPAPQGLEDKYRFITSAATKCPPPDANTEPVDPYKDFIFWNIDLKDRFTSDLTQTPLGRRFLYQTNMLNGKRPRIPDTISRKKSAKRKRVKL